MVFAGVIDRVARRYICHRLYSDFRFKKFWIYSGSTWMRSRQECRSYEKRRQAERSPYNHSESSVPVRLISLFRQAFPRTTGACDLAAIFVVWLASW